MERVFPSAAGALLLLPRRPEATMPATAALAAESEVDLPGDPAVSKRASPVKAESMCKTRLWRAGGICTAHGDQARR